MYAAKEVTMPAEIRFRVGHYTKLAETLGQKTQAERARHLRLSEATVSRVFTGKRGPSAEFIAAVLAAFPHYEFRDFFTVVDEEAAA